MNGSGPDRTPAEFAILSAVFVDGNASLSRIQESRIAFDDPRCRVLYDQLCQLSAEDKPLEASVVAEELKSRGKLDEVGGWAFLNEISRLMPTTASFRYYLDKARTESLVRDLSRAATSIVQECRDFTGTDPDSFVDEAERRIFAITQTRVSDRTQHAKPIVEKALSVIQTMISRKGEMGGLRTGFSDLDRYLWGMKPSEVIIIAGRPSQGKTAVGMNIVENVILPPVRFLNQKPAPAMVFSLEMSGSQLMQRMIASRARVNMGLLRDGLISKTGEEASRLIAASDELARAPLFIDDSSYLTVSHIRARARRQHAKTPLGCVVVDYLQLVTPSRPEVNREQQVAEASRGLKALAKELDVPVIVLSQLNRAPASGDRRPKLTDLRESGAIEQDADVVLMLARPRDADEDHQVAADTMDLIIAKNRNGPVGEVTLSFLRDIVKFENHHR